MNDISDNDKNNNDRIMILVIMIKTIIIRIMILVIMIKTIIIMVIILLVEILNDCFSWK